MLGAIAIVPSAPVLVAELADTAADEVADIRAAVTAAAAMLPPRWVAVGVGAADGVVDRDAVGSFAGFGTDFRVRLSPLRDDEPGPPADLPLCALMTAWVRGRARPEATAQVRVYAGDHDVDAALARGRDLRAEIDRVPDLIGVLVVADGVNTLTPQAPGGYDPGGAVVQLALDDALAAGDVAALRTLPPRVLGRAAFQVLAGLTGSGPQSAKELYRGAPYGVGYFVGVWLP
ncbi:hypothetical protein I546_4257 [Mycobacterium kansasii 732]|uniref:Uncharacterized protein n=1 Tax=Mycobacterium pseudokansasii TaxID=2341080 RepID=A0A498QPV8_9MYCO|nr:hypothetical protein [Mycobacterium pseudokansasii]EUA09544.1 hypothetical protein I546_4257 [Mycobacterium kansasii 732]KZS59272.1 hypothetical protein A4G27_24045 [Mycobacterium kansasii]MBY0388794.1 hypothetical protein [Mycobacterium pseudokansasii]VAZ93158.1 hypothetical protein LAUMK35_02202 [Mycobacterium pseudokansasii]VAZ94166.1 hypothetical protein LAUMK21_02201 [Mycobacterium pseudokansasii]